jgi:hypothetical protein
MVWAHRDMLRRGINGLREFGPAQKHRVQMDYRFLCVPKMRSMVSLTSTNWLRETLGWALPTRLGALLHRQTHSTFWFTPPL